MAGLSNGFRRGIRNQFGFAGRLEHEQHSATNCDEQSKLHFNQRGERKSVFPPAPALKNFIMSELRGLLL